MKLLICDSIEEVLNKISLSRACDKIILLLNLKDKDIKPEDFDKLRYNFKEGSSSKILDKYIDLIFKEIFGSKYTTERKVDKIIYKSKPGELDDISPEFIELFGPKLLGWNDDDE